MEVDFFNFKEIKDKRGAIFITEGSNHIPFDPKRIYQIHNVPPGVERGFHAHKELYQVATCIKGSCSIVLDDGFSPIETVKLSEPSIGVAIKPMIWHSMKDFSEGCVLIVYASEHYNEDDYIRNYESFKKLIKSRIS